ncbi:MAG: TRC40/GET3/ArsA family transport-energizing ATPase [Actinobacteria bacterium]|nr:TRC40/GET3/ArsA family transport-energizing ATPase [Actinomycetota bacterium]MBU4403784.1 TRC40/GET3/ArsA family transport-energizing ATPase [Actinomycetota bacterium]MCG2819290.1 TRC40/GET3/ArsA family transport-energizing ATPase [Actinomycetes bacterium]
MEEAEEYFEAGNSNKERGEYDLAEKEYLKAIDVAPDYSWAHNNLGIIYKRMGRFEKAIKAYERAVEITPGFTEAFDNLGIAYFELGLLELAIGSYEKSIELNPDNHRAHNNLGIAYDERGDYMASIAEYEKAIEIDPGMVEAHYNLGITYGTNGKHEQSISELEKAIDLRPGDPETHFNLALTYRNAGMLQQAVAEYEKAIRLRPGFLEAQHNLELTCDLIEHAVRGIENDTGDPVESRTRGRNAFIDKFIEKARTKDLPQTIPPDDEKEHKETGNNNQHQRLDVSVDCGPSFISRENLRLIIFGGKGGTGKTTSSAATALFLARLYPEKRVLVASSDPAHSLGDSFGCSLDSTITPIKGMDNLWGIEMNAASLFDQFRTRHKRSLKRLRSMSYSSDQIDIRDFLSFKLPGMEEMMILLKVVEMVRQRAPGGWEYDYIILDTAPTGHTLRLLALPKTMLEWLNLFDTTFLRYHRLSSAISSLGFFKVDGVEKPEAGVREFIEYLRKELEILRNTLQDRETCEFVPVTIPEELSVVETERLVRALAEDNIPVRNIIVNHVQDNIDCVFCTARRNGQEPYLLKVEELFSSYDLVPVPNFPCEVRGEESLLRYARELAGDGEKGSPEYHRTPSIEIDSISSGGITTTPGEDSKFIIFSGKGGVGKTTSSAATALYMAMKHPDKRILVFSTDPAHSLGDSYACNIGDEITPIGGLHNLDALELDGRKMYEEFGEEYRRMVEDAFQKWQHMEMSDTSRRKLDYDHKVMAGFIDTYPPGIEEVLALERIMGLMDRGAYDLYIFDTAPTGHLVELLTVPELVRDWLRITYRAILKYQRERPVEELRTLGNRMLASHKTVNEMRKTLTDPDKTEFYAVTIPEAMGILETEELLSRIGNLGIPCGHVVVNMVVPPTDCGFCSIKRNEQIHYVQGMKDSGKYKGRTISLVPLFPREIRGLDDLTELYQCMYEDKSAAGSVEGGGKNGNVDPCRE